MAYFALPMLRVAAFSLAILRFRCHYCRYWLRHAMLDYVRRYFRPAPLFHHFPPRHNITVITSRLLRRHRSLVSARLRPSRRGGYGRRQRHKAYGCVCVSVFFFFAVITEFHAYHDIFRHITPAFAQGIDATRGRAGSAA